MHHIPRPTAPIELTRRVILSHLVDIDVQPGESIPISPVILDNLTHRRLQDAAMALLKLSKRAALGAGDSTSERLEAYGATEQDYPLFTSDLAFEDRYSDVIARPDFVLTESGPKLLEFNVSGAVGGVPKLACRQAGLQAAYGRRDSIRWNWSNPYDDRARAFSNVAIREGVDGRVLVIGSTRDLQHTDSAKCFDLEVEALQRQGMVADFSEPEDLESILDSVNGNSRAAFPLSLRMFTIPEWAELGIDLNIVRRWLKGGSLLLTSQTASFLANKKTLAWLSEGMPWMTRQDRATVAEFVPWSRYLADRQSTLPNGAIGALLPFCLKNQERLVLKQAIGMQGLQVTIGREVTELEWHGCVTASAIAGNSIVQEYVEPCSQQVWMSHGRYEDQLELLKMRPIISFFVFGDCVGSGWARFRPDHSYGIVSCQGFGAFEAPIASN
ncbi:hypothetical protein LNV09_03205 [Paucibacter sp. B2R-40]|uniref:hypothetical protein n=1 Tax=Paucibacter sp. B2R-40 TaxID=2893554 RepID=UPI0021E445C8|nr:hypothetical protein [Paucibacter sp. B2R-40]MCV2353166.1 hypothetical protein [Paucibacter sp. B2R-40]